MVQNYGSRKDRAIHRWVIAARCLQAPVLQLLSERLVARGLSHGIVPGMLLDNTYIAGPGAQAKPQVPQEWIVVALAHVLEDIDNGKRIVVQVIRDD